MEPLMQRLLAEHAEILGTLDRVRHEGLAAPASQAAVAGLHPLLVMHLAQEDEHVYPALRELSRERAHLGIILTELEEEQVELKRGIDAFFQAWADGRRGGVACAADFGRLAADLRRRIHREEATLYAELGAAVGYSAPRAFTSR